jgi:AcrR family transcriptional regulator
LVATTADSTSTRILDAALALFSEHGFEGTTLQQIADRLGFTKAALYYHFKSKDELLEALVTPAVRGLDELLDEHEPHPGTPARQRAFLEAYVDYLLRHRRLLVYITRDLAVLGRPAIAERADEHRRRLEHLLTGTELDFNGHVRLSVAFGGLQAAIVQHPEASSDDLREALLEAARILLRPPHRTARGRST